MEPMAAMVRPIVTMRRVVATGCRLNPATQLFSEFFKNELSWAFGLATTSIFGSAEILFFLRRRIILQAMSEMVPTPIMAACTGLFLILSEVIIAVRTE